MHSLSYVWIVLSYVSLSFMVWGTTKEERLRDDGVLEVVGGVDLSNRNNNEEYQSYFSLHYGYISNSIFYLLSFSVYNFVFNKILFIWK